MDILSNKFEDNKWEEDETDSEYEDDEEYIQNEVPPPSLNEEFVNNVLKVKHSLYDNTILSPELGSSEAQSTKVLQDYLNHVNNIYILSINAQNGKISEEDINKFPKESRESIRFVLKWIVDYFSKNQIPDTIPYSDFLHRSFHEYQFVQNDDFD
jgi:hypothetical protein